MSKGFACGILLLCWLISSSNAQPSIASLQFTSSHHPFIDVEIDLIPPPTREGTFLVDEDGARAPAVRLERRSVPIDIVLVVSSTLAWIRNDVVEQDKRALSGLELVHALLASEAWREHAPTGSTIAIVSYDSTAHVVVSPSRLETLSAQPLGESEKYNDISASIAEGVRVGIEQLKPLTARRRLMVVIGDGVASDHDKDKALLKQLVLDASSASIAVRALVYGTWATKDDPMAITSLVSEPTIVHGIQDAIIAMRTAVDSVDDGYSATFDATSLDWDGETHMVSLETDAFRFRPMPVYLREQGRHSQLSSWRWPLLALALGVLVALVRAFRR